MSNDIIVLNYIRYNTAVKTATNIKSQKDWGGNSIFFRMLSGKNGLDCAICVTKLMVIAFKKWGRLSDWTF